MNRFIKIGEAAKVLGVSIQTLRRWEEIGYLIPERKSSGKTRYYSLEQLIGNKIVDSELTIAYARVSSHDQKEDLTRQAEVLAAYCTQHGWNFQVIQDLGSGMNYEKKGLKNLINLILDKKISRLVLTHKDRLLRFGAELIFALCEMKHIEVIMINKGDEVSFKEELAQDVLEIITVFSARLYGSRSRKNKKVLDVAQRLLSDVK
jgi:predicted site-specific integrase-resolvase